MGKEGGGSLTDLSLVIKRNVPTVQGAISALIAMRNELSETKTYVELQKVIREASAIKLLYEHVDEVRHEAEDTLITAHRRIGEELNAIPKAKTGPKVTSPSGEVTGRDATGISHTTRSRLQNLADIHQDDITRFSNELRAEDRDVTVQSVLKKASEAVSEERRAARRKQFEDTLITDNAYDYRIGRAQDVLLTGDIKTKEPRLILCDPPYEESADPLFDWLFGFAQDVLPVGGSLIVFTGHHRLPRDFAIVSKYDLRYWWLLSLRHNEARHLKGKFVVVHHKPVLWFVKGRRYNNEALLDVLTSEGRDKDGHEWSQGDGGISPIIDALTEPGDLIVEPFCGPGYWGKIAVAKKRRWIGCDVVAGGSTETVL
jgi:hypothetical protein